MSERNQVKLLKEASRSPDKVVMLGLDGEMSSADLATGGRLIQAGFAMMVSGRVEVFTSKIGHALDSWDDSSWSLEAAMVHNLSKEELALAPAAKEVDRLAYDWLVARGATPGRRSMVSIGFHVAAFDHPFFRKYLPKTMSLISRRAVDLNSLCFTLSGWDPASDASLRSWTGWKNSIKEAADAELSRLGAVVAHHNAGYDAAQAIVGWLWVRDQIYASSRPTRFTPKPEQERMLAAVFGSSLLEELTAYLSSREVRLLASAVVLSGLEAGKVISDVDTGGVSGMDLIESGRLGLLITRFSV